MLVSQKIIRLGESNRDLGDRVFTRVDTDNGIGGFGLVLFFTEILDETKLINGLERALEKFPYFAGRIVGLDTSRPRWVANNEGVLFTTVVRDKEMHLTWFQLSAGSPENLLVNLITPSEFDQHTPVFQVKLTLFSNGSTLGFTVSHYVCDGHSLWSFAKVWADSIRGIPAASLKVDRSILKVGSTDWGKTPSKIFPYVNRSDHVMRLCRMESRVFRLPAGLISMLEKVDAYLEGVSYQDLVMAYMWHALALSMNENRTGNLVLVHNVRRRIGVGDDQVGNIICLSHVEISHGEVITKQIADLARMIRAVSDALSRECIAEHFAFQMGEHLPDDQMQKSIALFLGGAVLINNWTRFPVGELDFGCGKPGWWDIHGPMTSSGQQGPMARRMILTRGGIFGESIDAYVVLPSSEMKKFGELIGQGILGAW